MANSEQSANKERAGLGRNLFKLGAGVLLIAFGAEYLHGILPTS